MEQEDRVDLAFDRMKHAKAHANECQVELDKIRVENSELGQLNMSRISVYGSSFASFMV